MTFATATRLPALFRRSVSPARAGGDRPARSGPSGPDRAPLDDFCNQRDPRAPPETARSPCRFEGEWSRDGAASRASGPVGQVRRLRKGARTKRASPEPLPRSSTGGAVAAADETEIPFVDREQRPAEVSRARMPIRPWPKPRPTAACARSSVMSRLCPTRSIRTPLVVRSPARWLETPALRLPHLTTPPQRGWSRALHARRTCRSRGHGRGLGRGSFPLSLREEEQAPRARGAFHR